MSKHVYWFTCLCNKLKKKSENESLINRERNSFDRLRAETRATNERPSDDKAKRQKKKR